jgi:hypothetical protein
MGGGMRCDKYSVLVGWCVVLMYNSCVYLRLFTYFVMLCVGIYIDIDICLWLWLRKMHD